MPAEVTTRQRPWYVARCPDCNDLYLLADFKPETVERKRDLHNKLAHSDPPKPHGQPRIDYPASVIGWWSVECACGYLTKLETSDEIAAWKCPLDRSEA